MRSILEGSTLFDNMMRSGRFGTTRKLLSGNYLIFHGGDVAHFLDPDGSNRNVILPANKLGAGFLVFNIGLSGNLVVKNALGVTVSTIESAKGAGYFSSETEWAFLTGAAAGVSYPSLRLVTAAGDVTVDADVDDHIKIKKTVGAATEVFLPPAANRSVGRPYKILDGKGDADTNPITITPDGADTIVGLPEWLINNQKGSAELWSDGVSEWYF